MLKRIGIAMGMVMVLCSIFFIGTVSCSAAVLTNEQTDSASQLNYKRDASGNIYIYEGSELTGTFLKSDLSFVSQNKDFISLVEYQPSKYKLTAADNSEYFFEDPISKTVTQAKGEKLKACWETDPPYPYPPPPPFDDLTPGPQPTPTPGGDTGGGESFSVEHPTPSYYEAFCKN